MYLRASLNCLCLATALLLLPFTVESADEPPKKTLFLPKNPVAAAYMLSRLSNQELIEAPRSEFVYVALLSRKGLDKKYRTEALEGLAKLRNSGVVPELIRALEELDKKGEEAAAVIPELAALLLQFKRAELKTHQLGLEKLSTESQLALVRQVGYAGVITANGSVDPTWRAAERKDQQTVDLVLAVPLLRDANLRREFYPKIEPLLKKEDQPELRHAAVIAIAAVPGFEAEVFQKLEALFESDIEQPTIIASLQRIPKKLWPQERAEPFVQHLTSYLEKIPVSERTQPEFIDAVQFAADLASLLAPDKAKSINKILSGLGVRVVMLRTIYEQMLYDKQRIVVEAGKPVEIVLENRDAMPHNLVIVAPGAVEEIGVAAEKMPVEPDANGRLYVPDSPKVLHATKLLATGEREKLSFTAPDEPGDYGYVCTFPGHWRRMTGTLVVTKDVEGYLAAHPESEAPQMTEWKVGDLAADLDKLNSGRNLENGRQLFTALACAQCHKLGTNGYSFGPELTDVFKRWKSDRAAVLGEIIEPSKIISARYRNYIFELKNGDSVSGMIVNETASNVTIHGGPSDTLIQTLSKTDIKSRHAQELSLMPVGLLNLMSKEQILDLLAYVESGGKVDSVHKH